MLCHPAVNPPGSLRELVLHDYPLKKNFFQVMCKSFPEDQCKSAMDLFEMLQRPQDASVPAEMYL